MVIEARSRSSENLVTDTIAFSTRLQCQRRDRPADTIGQGGTNQSDAYAFEDLALTLERQMGCVFANKWVGQKAGSEPAVPDQP